MLSSGFCCGRNAGKKTLVVLAQIQAALIRDMADKHRQFDFGFTVRHEWPHIDMFAGGKKPLAVHAKKSVAAIPGLAWGFSRAVLHNITTVSEGFNPSIGSLLV